jgi:hypothetical protein
MEDKMIDSKFKELNLISHIGGKLTEYMLGPDDSMRCHRIMYGEKIVVRITETYDVSTALAWLVGMNTKLDDISPALVIRSASEEYALINVYNAMQDFLEGQ